MGAGPQAPMHPSIATQIVRERDMVMWCVRSNALAHLRAPLKRDDTSTDAIFPEDGSVRGLPVRCSETLDRIGRAFEPYIEATKLLREWHEHTPVGIRITQGLRLHADEMLGKRAGGGPRCQEPVHATDIRVVLVRVTLLVAHAEGVPMTQQHVPDLSLNLPGALVASVHFKRDAV
jgi:hypothetical protein